MRILLISLIGLMLYSCSSNRKDENTLSSMNLKDNVKSLKEFSYAATEKFGDITKGKRERKYGWKKDNFIEFNEKGNKIEENWYNSDGSLDTKWTSKYDEKGNDMSV